MSDVVVSADPAAIRTHLGAIFVSLELSRSKVVVTSLSPGSGERLSRHGVTAGEGAALLGCLEGLVEKASRRTGTRFPLIVIQEAGLDGFWIDRLLRAHGIESHVVDAASVAVPRRARRVKTDRIDGEALVRVLLAYKRGEPRVCAMVRPPTPEAEDRRRLGREHATLTAERVRHVNRIKGLLFAQGIGGYEPLRRDRRRRLAELQTGDGRPLPVRLLAGITRELDRLELLLGQIAAVEVERDALLAETATAPEAVAPAQTDAQPAAGTQTVRPTVATPGTAEAGGVVIADPVMAAAAAAPAAPSTPALLMGVRGIGAAFATTLWTEGLCRTFGNRREIAAYAGLAPTPWRSGAIDREQGVSKAGNPRLRTAMIQLAWLWLRHQPGSALARWFHAPRSDKKTAARKVRIVALARKLLVALWRYASAGVLIEGAVLKPATAA